MTITATMLSRLVVCTLYISLQLPPHDLRCPKQFITKLVAVTGHFWSSSLGEKKKLNDVCSAVLCSVVYYFKTRKIIFFQIKIKNHYFFFGSDQAVIIHHHEKDMISRSYSQQEFGNDLSVQCTWDNLQSQATHTQQLSLPQRYYTYDLP